MKETSHPVARFFGDKIFIEVFACHPSSIKMLKIKEIDVTGNIGQQFHQSKEVSKGGNNLFTILDDLRAISPECEIKISVRII